MRDRWLDQWRYLGNRPAFKKAPLEVLLRLVIWRVMCALGAAATIRLDKRALLVHVPSEWNGPAKLIFAFRDEYEPDLAVLGQFLAPGGVMLDVGAGYGIYSLVASRLVGPGGRVLAFEPAQAAFEVIQRNLNLNGMENVQAFRLALSDRAGEARLYHDRDPSRNSLAGGQGQGRSEIVRVATLDELHSEMGISRVDFIKIDAEGLDERVCRGARILLSRFLPPVLFEHDPAAAVRAGLGAGELWQTLADLGYEFYRPEERGLRRLVQGTAPAGNVLARATSAGGKA